jgi:hypothetical protein
VATLFAALIVDGGSGPYAAALSTGQKDPIKAGCDSAVVVAAHAIAPTNWLISENDRGESSERE